MDILCHAKLMSELSNEGLDPNAVLRALTVLSHRYLQHDVHVKTLKVP